MPDTQLQLLDPQFLHRLEQLELVSRKIFLGVMKGERSEPSARAKASSSPTIATTSRATISAFSTGTSIARLDRLFIRLFQEEEDLHFYVLIDNSLSMDFGSPTKLHYARQVAAALAFIGLVNMDRVVIEAFNDRLTQTHAGDSWPQESLWRLLDFLQKLEAGRLRATCAGARKPSP